MSGLDSLLSLEHSALDPGATDLPPSDGHARSKCAVPATMQGSMVHGDTVHPHRPNSDDIGGDDFSNSNDDGTAAGLSKGPLCRSALPPDWTSTYFLRSLRAQSTEVLALHGAGDGGGDGGDGTAAARLLFVSACVAISAYHATRWVSAKLQYASTLGRCDGNDQVPKATGGRIASHFPRHVSSAA